MTTEPCLNLRPIIKLSDILEKVFQLAEQPDPIHLCPVWTATQGQL